MNKLVTIETSLVSRIIIIVIIIIIIIIILIIVQK